MTENESYVYVGSNIRLIRSDRCEDGNGLINC